MDENPQDEAIHEPQVEETVESSDETTPSKEEVESLRAELEKEREAKRQLTARAKQAEDKLKASKPLPTEGDEDIRKTVKELSLAESKRQFGYANGLSPEETDYLFKISPTPSKELLDDPFVKGGIQAIRAKRKIDNNTPSSTSRSPKFALPKKEDLTSDDKQAAFEKFVSEKMQSKRN